MRGVCDGVLIDGLRGNVNGTCERRAACATGGANKRRGFERGMSRKSTNKVLAGAKAMARFLCVLVDMICEQFGE